MSYNFRGLRKGEKVSVAAILVSLVASILFSGFLPEKIASHWNLDGMADGFLEKELFLIGFPLLLFATLVAMSYLPRVKELKFEMELLRHEYSNFTASIIVFLLYVQLVILYSNTNFGPLQVSTSQLLFPGIAVLLYYLGTVLPRLKRNHFVGIRTPWTIDNEEVWRRTHQIGGKLFKALSVAVMLATLTSSSVSTWLVIAPILLVGVFLLVYSYKLSEKIPNRKRKKIEKPKKGKIKRSAK